LKQHEHGAMKILVVTNFYPPHHIGGYELGCRDVVEKLRARGHTLRVLTSSFRHRDISDPPGETEVERSLQLDGGPGDPPHDKRAECAKLSDAIRRFGPDAVYFWNQGGLCYWLPLAARWHRKPVAFFLSDTNFISWRIAAWLRRWTPVGTLRCDVPARSEAEGGTNAAERVSGQPVPSPDAALGDGERRSAPSLPNAKAQIAARFIQAVFGKTFLVQGRPVIAGRTCHFASEFLRGVAEKNGIRVAEKSSLVAHWGIEPSQFAAAPRERWPVRRLLYAGQMIPQKGVHTAIAAFALLAKEPGFEDLTFSLAGGGMHPDYERNLREMPEQLGVAGRVRFLGKVPRAGLPRIYAEHDVLVFPSEWDEPFAITPLEAMAGGLAVVGTTTGGSGELFRNRETALTFRAGDAADCARSLRELCGNRTLFEKICSNAQREVRENHTLDAMVDKIEQSLEKLKS
jgi:glycosyltransferase involved in cell wall biosynthesis